MPVLLAWWLVAAGTVAAAPAASAPLGQDAVRIMGREYWDAQLIGRRFGLTARFDPRTKEMRLASRWTTIVLQPNDQEIQINDLNVFLSDPVAVDHGRYFISRRDAEDLLRPILVPRSASPPPRVRTIVVDAGHGGNDHGNENDRLGVMEKTMTLDVARRLAGLLTAAGFHVVMTRTADRRVELDDRVALAARVHADLFVSIHFNSFTQPNVAGAETYVMTPEYARSTPAREHDQQMRVTDFPGNRFDHWNTVLGYEVQRAVVDGLGATDRGFKRYRYYVLRMTPCPAVLVEAGFLSNTAEGEKVKSSFYRARIAQAISDGIKSYASAVDGYRTQLASRRRER